MAGFSGPRKRKDPESDTCVRTVETSHHYVREVRDHPDKPGKRQDRMACTGCEHVLYDWAGAF